MADIQGIEVPQTLEGWYVLHDVYRVDWPEWWRLDSSQREKLARHAAEWLTAMSRCEKGDSACYSVLSQKGDLLFVHYRSSPDDINQVERSLRRLGLFEYLRPCYSYFSAIEISLYELTGTARKKLSDQGLKPGEEDYDTVFEMEMEKQQTRVKGRLFRKIPSHRYICFYPMSKRRGEQFNWYSLTMEERRDMMRSHGRIGHKYHSQVVQVIGGSTGLDDWEWGVSLHSNDAMIFKKLVYEMRFDPASALYAEFGQFYVGIRRKPEALVEGLCGD